MHCQKATGGQDVQREGESEGLEERYRAVIEGQPVMDRSANGGARSSRHCGGEGAIFHPSNRGLCDRHGTEALDVPPGGLVAFALVFEREEDAQWVLTVLAKRFARYGLRLHPEQTSLVDFRRSAQTARSGSQRERRSSLPGFTLYWGAPVMGARWCNAMPIETGSHAP